MNWQRYFVIAFFTCMMGSAQDGVFINGPDAAFFVPGTNTLYCNGDFKVMDCDPVLQVRFSGSLYLTKNLEVNKILRFNPTQAADSKLCRLIFLPGNQSSISGTVAPVFWELEIDKGIGNSVILNNSIICRDTLNFKNGFLYINGRHCTLQDPVGATDVLSHPWIKGERNGAQFLPANGQDTGKVIYNSIYTSSVNFEAANIGLRIIGLVNIGSPISIIRGFKNQVNAAKGSVGKYMDVYSPGHKLVNNTISLNFYLNDAATSPFNFINTTALQPYLSPLTDNNWTPFTATLTTPPVSPFSINGNMLINLNQLRHPFNFADSTAFRLTLADPDCSNPPLSVLGADTVHICSGDSLVLDPGNVTAIPNSLLRYAWSTFPPLYNRTILAKPTAVFQKLKVLLMDVKGCVTRDSVFIAPAAPFPQINYCNFLNACLGDSVQIKDTVTINSGTYSNNFFFSDQTLLVNNQNFFRKKFNAPGTYSFVLNSVSNFGCVTSVTRTNVQVYPLPTAAFSASLNCVTRQIDFSNLSTSNTSFFSITNSQWLFGDLPVSSSTLSSPSHSYSSSGIYTVSLRSKTNFGCKDSVLQSLNVVPQNTALFSRNNICLGDTCILQNLSTCATGSCSSYWDLGDLSNDTTINPRKKYQSAGFYQIKLKTTAAIGCADSLTLPVFVHARPIATFSLSSIDFCPNEPIYCTNNSSLSSGVITGVNWVFDNQPAGSSWNFSTNTSLAGLHSIQLTLLSDSGCIASAQETLSVHPAPQAQLLAFPVCRGDTTWYTSVFQSALYTYNLDPGLSIGTYTSSQGVMPIVYNQAGTYTAVLIVISNFGCSDTATFAHTVLPVPLSPFQGTISTCGTSYVLNALNTGCTYNWWPGNQITNTVLCQQNGNYQVVITNTDGCTSTENIQLKLNAIVKPQLGKDTIHCGPLNLNAGYPGANIIWNTGNISNQLTVNNSGTYIVTVTDQNACTGSDTVVVTIKDRPNVSAGQDITICQPKGPFALSVIGDALTYKWSTNQNGTFINVQTSGLYWVEGTALNACKKRDSILLTFLKTPTINLAGPMTACAQVILDAKNNGNLFLWENGTTLPTRTLTSTSKVWVKVTNPQNGCAVADTSEIKIYPIPFFNLGPDTAICNNVLYVLKTGSVAGSILWTNGTSAGQVTVTSAGIYGASIVNEGACLYSDYVTIQKLTSPQAELGLPLRYLCGDQALQFSCKDTNSIAWYLNGLALSTATTINAVSAGMYKLQISNGGCTDQDSVLVSRTSQTVQAKFLASTIDTINRSVKFVNLSVPSPVRSWWDFGDGQQSEVPSPEHTWFLPDDFKVRLKVSNGFCEDETSTSLRVIFRTFLEDKKTEDPLKYSLLFYPNPAVDELTMHAEFNSVVTIQFSLTDLSGRTVLQKNLSRSEFFKEKFSVSGLSQGVYFIHLVADASVGRIINTKKLIIAR